MTHTLKNTLRNMVLGLAAALMMTMMVGCLYINPNPALMTTARTPGQQLNKYVRIPDNNLRGVWDDIDRIMFLEHNLRLTPYPMP